jgi:cyanate permease
MSVFEIGMLFCFGFAWPLNIYKSIKSKSTEGKSVWFLYVIFIGYIFGIIHKLLNDFDLVIILYIINATMVLIDMLLFYRNKNFNVNRTKVI